MVNNVKEIPVDMKLIAEADAAWANRESLDFWEADSYFRRLVNSRGEEMDKIREQAIDDLCKKFGVKNFQDLSRYISPGTNIVTIKLDSHEEKLIADFESLCLEKSTSAKIVLVPYRLL